MQIIHPSQAPTAYRLAAQVFQEYYAAVTGRCLPLATQAEHSQLVVIGGTDVNAFARDAMLDGWGPDLAVASGSDEYGLFSTVHEGRKVLFLWGGRGRSTLYAVYHFFEKQAGCRYFWDGDIIPKSTELSIDGWNQVCKPDFALRGLRYFAHRGLHRFQAEHWSMEDWKQEIDWLLKRGLNMFMLRIGSDDLFQKAFPQWVDYPSAEEKLPEAGEGYDNRTLFWSLQYRGQLRKQVLRYAFDRDLIHPEDCGTTTHWYTRTPVQYLDQVKPAFMPQVTEVYRQPTGLVWDIRQDQNMDAYFALTKAHIREYGQPQIFHTIGLAERMCSQNREQNMRFKRMAYRRILERVEREWPGKPVLIASWDFAMHWEPPEVRQLLHELDPRRHIIFDYTADTQSTENNFLHWGFYRKFPWIFGIFHAFEPNSDLRGDYHQLSQRLELARMDEQCKGLVFWPELSHSDILMLEYFSKSAWNRVDEKNFMSDFCEDRYGKDAPAMLQLWQSLWPLMPLRVWQLDPEAAIEDIHQEYFFDILGYRPLTSWLEAKLASWHETLHTLPMVLESCGQVLLQAAPLWERKEPFLNRDRVDIVRTALGRALNGMLLRLVCDSRDGYWQEAMAKDYMQLLTLLCDVLDSHEDYSQYVTLEGLKRLHAVNPIFEPVLMQNLVNGYCRGYASEFMRNLCVSENKAYLLWLQESAYGGGIPADTKWLKEEKERLYTAYMARTLKEMRPTRPTHMEQRLKRTAQRLAELSKLLGERGTA